MLGRRPNARPNASARAAPWYTVNGVEFGEVQCLIHLCFFFFSLSHFVIFTPLFFLFSPYSFSPYLYPIEGYI